MIQPRTGSGGAFLEVRREHVRGRVDAEDEVGVDVGALGLCTAFRHQRQEKSDAARARRRRRARSVPAKPRLDRELRQLELGRIAECDVGLAAAES
jgi:hypothetical protein